MQRNLPHDPQSQGWTTIHPNVHPLIPDTPMQALMEAGPTDVLEESLLERQPVREAVAECMRRLTDEHRFVLEAIHAERLSVRDLAKRLGVSKSTAQRRHDDALAALEPLLTRHPVIQRRLNMEPTWDTVVREHLDRLDETSAVATADVATVHRQLVDKMETVRRRANSHVADTDRIAAPMWAMAIAAARWLREYGEWSVDDLHYLLCSKQHDYGHGNILAFGIFGVVVRLSDKVARLENLLSHGEAPKNESIVDTLHDVIGYAVIARMLADEQFALELGDNWQNEVAA